MNNRRSFIAGFLVALVSVGLFVAVPVFFGDIPDVSAQALTGDQFFGGEGAKGTTFAESLGLSPGPSIQVMIARIIRTVIGFVGIIAVIMILYAGFLYMTAGGNATRLATAKKIMTQAIIGLVIVLTSFTIVYFIVGKLVDATGGGVESEEDGGTGAYPDGGKASKFTLTSVNTQCAQALRNLQLQFVFSKNVNEATVQEAISIKKIDGSTVEGTFATKGSLVTFTPSAACPEPNPTAKCFEANTTHEVAINAGVLKSTSGASLTCTTESPCQFSFSTGMGVDVTGPTVIMSAPANGQSVIVGDIALLQAQTKDDTGVSSVDFFVVDSDQPIFTSGLPLSTNKGILGDNEVNAFSTDPDVEWNTAGYVTNKSYPIWASASDCAGNTAQAAKISVSVLSANCGNGEKDADLGETDIDCGGDPQSEFYCKKCDGDDVANGSECASGVVENSKCVTKPRIDMVSPSDGAFGNLITISGAGFGDTPGFVTFFDKDKQVGFKVQPYQCVDELKWSKTQIVVQVPVEATDGPIEIETAEPNSKTDLTDDPYGPLIANFDVNAIKRPGLCQVDPESAKPGSEVTVSGLGFGAQKGTSTLFFKSFVSPSYTSWADKQLKVVVPNMNAEKVKTQIFTGDYRCIDVTGKELGKLCAEDKDCGAGNTCAKSWCSETLAYCTSDAACGEVGGICGSVRVGSNKIKFSVEDTTPDATAPVISYVDTGWKACEGGANNGKHCAKKEECGDGECKPAQNWGPIGQYVTIYGSGFGSAKGSVFFQSGLGKNALGDTDFPDQCGDQFWSDSSITVKVPKVYQAGGNVDAGIHHLSVKKGVVSSNSVEFVVVDDSPGPAICKIDPVAGPAKTKILLYGENLSSQKGSVKFFENQQANYLFWESTKVTDVVVPEQAKTGPVSAMTQAGYISNSVNFTVGSCQEDLSCPVGSQCCDDGSCKVACDLKPKQAHFAYKISTGLIPETPTVIAKCDDKIKSPTPWENWPDSKTVCLNAIVSATFSKSMNQASLSDNVVVEACADLKQDGSCGAWNKLKGVLETSAKSFNWDGDADFASNTLHRVTVLGADGGVQATKEEGGAFMAEDYSWQFTTAGANAFCQVGGVMVTPSEFTATQQDDPANPNDGVPYLADILAKGYQCVKMSCKDQIIAWSSNFAGAQINDPASTLCSQQVNTLSETQGKPAKIGASVTNANPPPSDTGDLIIDFSDPSVAAFFPNCQSACVNAKPWVRFKAKMDVASLKQGTTLYECIDALCAKNELSDASLISDVTYDWETKTMFVKTKKSFKPDKWYRVVLSGTIVKSVSQVQLKDSGSNFGTVQNQYFQGDFSWKFKIKNSDLLCTIDSLAVSPKAKTLTVVGERQAYVATAYNAPDDCDVSGQALQDASYTWQAWKAADNAPEKNPASSKDIAFLLNNGAIKLAPTLPAWCSSMCLKTGTSVTNAQALCGDGLVNGLGKKAAEECDGGNSCSGSCLWKGTATCAAPGEANCCGNGVVNPGEQCDDGGHVDGGGCSAVCLNEGSGAVGAVCGDGVVDHVVETGGEDCDDGNNKNGDGCSSQCLFEGSAPFGNTFAVCGNGVVENGEDCDGGVGCSAKCLHEGTPVCALVCSNNNQTCATNLDCTAPATCGPAKTPCCGNGGVPENGEDCDDGNGVSADGCSSQCLKEGASILYDSPTYCGDGKVQLGEECDAAAGQTLAIGGFAAAQISSNVYKEVPVNGGYAISTITATADNVTGTAALQIDCSCQTDQACGSPTTIGCGAGSCCFPRPDAVVFEPAGKGPGNQGFCRNTTVRVKFNQKMDPDSFGAVDKDADGKIEQGELANLRLELLINDGKNAQNNQANCPGDYVFAQAAQIDESPLARLWNWIKRTAQLFFGDDAYALGTDCIAPATYTLVDAADGQWVYLDLQKPLEKNSSYVLKVIGDNKPLDGATEGVKSTNGVGACFGNNCVIGSKFSSFKTGAEVCLLEAVSIADTEKIGAEPFEPPSPQFFSKIKEEHKFVSQALTYRDGLGVYEPISGTNIYNWGWEWGSAIAVGKPENIVDGAPQEDLKNTLSDANFVAVGNNGIEHVLSTATISVDTLNNPTTKGTPQGTVAGTLDVTALTCENPWPIPDPITGWKPYIEKTDPAKPSNFEFYYCLDRGAPGPDGDLPELDAPIDVTSAAINGLIQEILFKVQGTPDAIGVRVIQNPNYLSPKAWFESQKFTGGYAEIEMDGYQGVQSGNTAYVAAANEHGVVLYPNIYVVSYNPNAGADAKEIFAQLLKNWRFNANTDVVSNVGLCKAGGVYVKDEEGNYIECQWDGQCAGGVAGVFCDNEKAKIQKDMKRLTDITTQISTLSAYGSKHKHCSVTKTQSCSVNAECPGTEKCVAGYPTVQQGTFVPSLSVSKWPSWVAEFSNELGTAMPSDPLNAFWLECKNKGEKYDPATCFNGLEGKFVCPDKSHVYGYQSKGGEAYTLFSQLEYTGAHWGFAIDQFPNDSATVVAEYATGQAPGGLLSGFVSVPQFCSDDKVWGVSAACGDGVVGQGEVCEPGQIQAKPCAVDGKNGLINTACTNQCVYQSVDQAQGAGAMCVPDKCGNGILEGMEKCDDGALNGTYGHCGSSCTFSDAFLCGDGYLAGGEMCDCGTVEKHEVVKNQAGSWANQNKNTTCQVANGQYGQVKDWIWGVSNFVSCSYDCKLPGPSCGDKEINGAEQCDGGLETSNSDCPISKVCVGGNTPGIACAINNQCGVGVCSNFTYQLSRTRACDDQCAWSFWSVCKGGDQQCGNGKKEGAEECDDGNQSNNDSCTTSCKANVCGDNFVFTGVESCDNGAANVLPDAPNACSAPYGGNCNYCNTLCQYKTASGAYCGDGKINGTEFCDWSERPYYCFDTSSGKERKGTCLKSNANKVGQAGGCEAGFTCRDVGVCNGGTNNGQFCTAGVGTDTASCPGGQCVFPVCAGDCSATCPSTFKETSILIQSELPDSQPLQSIELFSFLNKDNLSPDSAVLHLPACQVGTKISANVDNKNVVSPPVDIVFVTDLTASMQNGVGDGKTRIQAASDAIVSAVDSLFAAYSGAKNAGKMRIGLVSYGWTKSSNQQIDGNTEFWNKAKVDVALLTGTPTNKQTLKAKVKEYPLHSAGSSNPQGVVEAIKLLKDQSPAGTIKIIVLLSDGAPWFAMDGANCSNKQNISVPTEAGNKSFSGSDYCIAEERYLNTPVDLIHTQTQSGNIYFYSGIISNNNTDRAYMEHLSSMGCKGNSMSDLSDCEEGAYAYNATTADGIKQMYEKIAQSILSANTTVTATKNGSTQSATGLTPVGNNVNIPIPATFQCQNKPFTMPIKTSFYGTGTMKFDNFTFTYCPLQ